MKINLKRGYSVDVDVSKNETDAAEIIEIGNYSKSGYMATIIVGGGGISPTVRENHGQVIGIIEEWKK